MPNFLATLARGAKSLVERARGGVASLLGIQTSPPSGTISTGPTQPIPATFAPTMSTPFGPATEVDGRVIRPTSRGGIDITPLFQSSISTFNVRPAIPSTPFRVPGVQQAEGATAPPIALSGGGGRPVPTPPTGTQGSPGLSSGLSFGGGGLGFTPQTGTSGFGGRSAFTGLLGAAGGLGTPSLFGIATDEQRKREEEIRRNAITAQGKLVFDPITGQLVLQRTPISTFSAGEVPPTISPQVETQKVPSRPDLLKSIDEQLETARIRALEIKEQIDRLNPTPTDPVVDTEAQKKFLESLEPSVRPNLQAQLDEFRKNSGLTQFETQRLDILKSAEAARLTREELIKDIEDNPNLPEGLKNRRKQVIENEYSNTIRNLSASLEIVNQSISDLNDQLNFQFKILESEEDKLNRDIDNKRQQVSLLVSSGAIANFSDEDLERISNADLGFDFTLLKSVKTSIENKEEIYSQFSTQTDTQGNVTVLGIKRDGTVDKLRTVKGVAKPISTTTKLPITQSQLNRLATVGINQSLALKIQQSLQTSSTEEVRNALIRDLGEENGKKVWSNYTDIIGLTPFENFLVDILNQASPE